MKDLDLNLLRFFDELYRRRHLTRAAEFLDITQPAASQRLQRLRDALKDPLFVRMPGGLRPTPTADRVAPAIRAGLESIDQGLHDLQGFDPMTSHRRFRFHMSDTGEALFLPRLLNSLESHAPHLELECQIYTHDSIATALDEGQLDFALGYLPSVTGMDKVDLTADHYLVLMGHPGTPNPDELPSRISLAELRQREFVAARSHTEPLRVLEQLGLGPRIRQTTASILALLEVVKQTELCAIMPRITAQTFAEHGGLKLVECDFLMGPFTVSLYWSRRYAHFEFHRWMRRHVEEHALG